MDKNKIYKALYLYHIEEYKDTEEIAQKVDILPRAVEKVLQSKGIKDVEGDFYSDWKQNDFTRVYEQPKLKKLDSNAVTEKRQDYLLRLEKGKIDIEEIKYFLLKDNVSKNQAENIVEKVETQYLINHRNENEDKLFQALEVQKLPCMWKIQNGKVIDVSPKPVFGKFNNVTGVKYESNKSLYLPEELWQTYIDLQNEIEQANKNKHMKI